MTCIVGIVRDGEIYIGTDSLACSGWGAIVCEKFKAFRKGEFVFGLSGSPRMKQLLDYSLELPPLPEGDLDLFKYVAHDIVESVRKCLRDGGYLQKEKDRESAEGSYFLVGGRGRLFRIGSDLEVTENIWGYDAIGSGGDFALGSLYRSLTIGEETESAIVSALMAAEQFNIGVRGPFHIISTKEGYNA